MTEFYNKMGIFEHCQLFRILLMVHYSPILIDMKIAGIVLLIIGLIGLVWFGYGAMQESESYEVLGAEVAVSTANWTPVIVSGVVALIGLILTVSKKSSKT